MEELTAVEMAGERVWRGCNKGHHTNSCRRTSNRSPKILHPNHLAQALDTTCQRKSLGHSNHEIYRLSVHLTRPCPPTSRPT